MRKIKEMRNKLTKLVFTVINKILLIIIYIIIIIVIVVVVVIIVKRSCMLITSGNVKCPVSAFIMA